MEDKDFSLQTALASMQGYVESDGDYEMDHVQADALMSKIIRWVAEQELWDEDDVVAMRTLADLYDKACNEQWWYA